jgi:hypothetical protein
VPGRLGGRGGGLGFLGQVQGRRFGGSNWRFDLVPLARVLGRLVGSGKWRVGQLVAAGRG